MKILALRGFTLIELLITIAVLAVIMGIGIPTFQDTMRNNRLTARANQLSASISLAQSASQNGIVSMCAANGNACAGTPSWSNGWLVFIEKKRPPTGNYVGTGANPDVLLRAVPSNRPIVTNSGGASSLIFQRGDTTPSTFIITEPGCRGENKYEVRVASSGNSTVRKLTCP